MLREMRNSREIQTLGKGVVCIQGLMEPRAHKRHRLRDMRPCTYHSRRIEIGGCFVAAKDGLENEPSVMGE